MRIMMVGLRSIPSSEGGIEKHVESLAPLLVRQGMDVEVLVRRPYRRPGDDGPWRGVDRTWIYAPRLPLLETIVHSLLGAVYAIVKRPDVLHVHGIGPSLMVPLAWLFGLKTVVTHHGFDYDREKWGALARAVLRLGEWAGVRFASGRVVISQLIRSSVEARFGVSAEVIHNGVDLPRLGDERQDRSHRFPLTPGRYVLQVSRFVPEKRQLDLIEAFKRADLPGWKLALVGTFNPACAYGRQLEAARAGRQDIVLTGFQFGDDLHWLFANAGLFVLPSSHEGMPIALLEAMSYGNVVLTSDIPAHLELALPKRHYFRLGDVKDLTARMHELTAIEWNQARRELQRSSVAARYDWSSAALKTARLYAGICRAEPSGSRVA